MTYNLLSSSPDGVADFDFSLGSLRASAAARWQGARTMAKDASRNINVGCLCSSLGVVLGVVLVGGFILLWAYAFFGGIWAWFRYDGAAEQAKAAQQGAEKIASYLAPIVDKLGKIQEEVGLLRAAVERGRGGEA